MIKMNPDTQGEIPSIHVPERLPQSDASNFAGRRFETQGIAAPEQGNIMSQGLPLAQSAQQTMVAPDPGASTSQLPQQGASMGLPAIADDADLIEKEWVLKAKEIVARTKGDPYRQNEAIQHVKADYIKKRYNKDVKLREG